MEIGDSNASVMKLLKKSIGHQFKEDNSEVLVRDVVAKIDALELYVDQEYKKLVENPSENFAQDE